MALNENVIRTLSKTHRIQIEVSNCLLFRSSKSDCAACFEFCPGESIELSHDGPKITGDCINCGVCYAACPTSVFSIEDGDDTILLNKIREVLKRNNVGEFRISCIHGDRGSELIVPCLSRLTEALLLEPMLAGASGVEILKPSCEECSIKKASPLLEKVFQRSYHLFELLGFKKESLRKTNIPFPGFIEIRGEQTSRRAFLGSIGKKAGQAAVSSLPEIVMKDDDSPNKSFREILQSPGKNAKRSILLALLNGFTSTGNVEISIKESPLLEFNVSPDCNGCNTCATLCPTGAIVHEAVENRYQLKFRPHLCVNCRTCVNTCLYKAIQPKETALLNNLLEKPESVVFKGEKRSCPICQIDYIGSKAEICPFCLNTRRKKNDLISSLLENTEGRNKHVW